MTFREKLYSRAPRSLPKLPTLGQVANFVEVLAFIVLTAAILTITAKGVAVTAGMVPLLEFGVYLRVFVGLIVTFLSLVVLSVLLDGGHQYREFLKMVSQIEEEQENPRGRR